VIYYAYRLDSPETPSSSSLKDCRSPSSYVLRFALSTCDNNPRSRCAKFFVDPYHMNRRCYRAGVGVNKTIASHQSRQLRPRRQGRHGIRPPCQNRCLIYPKHLQQRNILDVHSLPASIAQFKPTTYLVRGGITISRHKTWGKF